MMRLYTNKTIATAIEMYIAQGVSASEISRELGVSDNTVQRWIDTHYITKKIEEEDQVILRLICQWV